MFDYHSNKIKACLQNLKTLENGLSSEEVKKRFKKYGLNEIPKEKSLSKLMIFIYQFNNPLAYILLFAGVLSLILGEIIDSAVIFTAIFLNVIIGYIQESKASQAITKLKSLVEHKAFVLRNGHKVSIDSKLVTVGDIVLVEAGNRIPADARLIEGTNLQVNEASLTGESLPSSKDIKEVPKGAALADRENMVYASTMVVQGLGKAVVTAIGKETEIGKIAEMVKEAKEEKTPLQLRLRSFSRQLGIIFGAICLIIIFTGLSQGRDLFKMIETGVAIGVASIPEGLTVSVTFILALGMRQILKKRALARKLVAAETLGSTTVICSDKTGTLTEGHMHVDHIVIGEKEFEIESLGSSKDLKEAGIVRLALQSVMLCNNAVVENPDDALASWRIIGSPTEMALLSAAIQSGLRKDNLLKIEPRINEMPFDSDKKFMLSLHKKSANKYILYEKGAPELLLNKSVRYYHKGDVHQITDNDRKKLNKTYEKLTNRGLRVIGIAIRELDNIGNIKEKMNPDMLSNPDGGRINWSKIDNNLTFIGFIALKDPLRPEAKDTIKMCREAGIRPIIITGDHKLTAKAIAEEVGFKVKSENIIIGTELENINDEELIKLVKKIDIYARVNPHHKLRIVNALQDSGEVVAMTGDGINDSPALKKADIGISLGTGTDIAKETSDIVLLDNNFKTIVAAVKQGRVIFNNIRKVITFLISDSFTEMILIVSSILLHAPLAILPVQILWINIVVDGFPDFSLAFEKGNDSLMKEKPIKKNEPLLNKEMKLIIFLVGLIRDLIILSVFFLLWQQSTDIDYLRSLIFAIVGVKSLISIFSIRSFHRPIWKINPFSNPYLIGAVTISFTLLALGIHWRPLQNILSTVDINLFAWLIAFMIGLLSVAMIEIVKLSFIGKGKKAQAN